MRFATFELAGGQRIGLVEGEEVADITSLAPDMQAVVEGGAALIEEVRARSASFSRHALASIRLCAPFPRPRKNILCLGSNYRAHAAEGARALGIDRADAPQYPVWFTKGVTSVCGPYDDIVVDPDQSEQYDWEVELLAVIGKAGRHIRAEDAYSHVHSYTVFNDFSVRDVQFRHGKPPQWFKGKSFENTSPMGPWLVTADEFDVPPDLNLTCRVNGVVKQQANTLDMTFDIATAIADISEAMTLEPGDLIATGTPAGVGFARQPPEFLKPGDTLESEVSGIGLLRNDIRRK